MNAAQLESDMRELSARLHEGIQACARYAREHAAAERRYRQSVAEAWVKIPDREWLAKRQEDWVKAETAPVREERDTARDLMRAADLAVRARQTEMSSLQTVANAFKAEAELLRTGPEMTP